MTKKNKIYFGSLFSGIGGIDLGLERAGMTCRWQIENDPFCNRILQKHWPEVKRYKNVKEPVSKEIKAKAKKIQLLAGGFPCQDLSSAGKKTGIYGKKSSLWFEFEKFICELRPKVVFLENVPGLLSRGFDIVLGGLATLGYDAEWDCIPAAFFGAPHLRHRVFIIAYSQCNRRGKNFRIMEWGGANNTNQIWKNVPNRKNWKQIWNKTSGDFSDDIQKKIKAEFCRVDDGIPNRVDRIRTLGNSVVPQVSEWIGKKIMKAFGWN